KPSTGRTGTAAPRRSAGACPSCWPSGSPPEPGAAEPHRFHGVGGEVVANGALGDADMPTDLHVPDASLLDEPPREADARAETFGDLVHGEESLHGHHSLSSPAWSRSASRAVSRLSRMSRAMV